MRSRSWIPAAAIVAGLTLIGTGTAVAWTRKSDDRVQATAAASRGPGPSRTPSAGVPVNGAASASPSVTTVPSVTSIAPAATTARPAATAGTTTAPACGTGAFNAEVVLNGDTWTSRKGDRVVYTGTACWRRSRRRSTT